MKTDIVIKNGSWGMSIINRKLAASCGLQKIAGQRIRIFGRQDHGMVNLLRSLLVNGLLLLLFMITSVDTRDITSTQPGELSSLGE